MLAYVQVYLWRRKADTNDAEGTVSFACAHLQRSEQTFSLFCNKSACSSVDEANFQDHRSRGLAIAVEAPNGRKPSEVEANEFE